MRLKQIYQQLRSNDLFLMLLLSAAALAVRLYFVPFCKVISADGIAYAKLAKGFITGHGLSGATHFPPLYPILVGLTYKITNDIELAGRLVSCIMGSLGIFPLFLLGKEFFSRRVAVVASILLICWPTLRLWSCEVMSQATYITLLLAAILLLWRAYKLGSLTYSAFGAGCMALAYLTRPEAVMVFMAAIPVLVLASVNQGMSVKRLSRLTAACVLVFLVFSFPYINLLHQHTGKWQLTGKTSVTLADAIGNYLGRPDLKHEPGFTGLGYLDVIREYPDFLKQNIVKNTIQFIQEGLQPLLWLFLIVGFVSSGWGRQRLIERGYLLATLAPLPILIIFFFTSAEYIQPFLPVMFLWTGQGICWFENMLLRQGFLSKAAGLVTAIPPSAVAVSIFAAVTVHNQLPADPNAPYHFSQDGGRFDHKRIGLLLKEHLPAGATIMTRSGRIGFYSELPIADLPQASMDEIIATARKSGVRFLIVDGMLVNQRPQLEPLFGPLFIENERIFYLQKGDGMRFANNLKLYLLYKDPSSLGVAVYQLD